MKNEVLNYRGNTITFELGNGQVMVNATEMAKPFGKEPHDWLKLKSTREFLQVLENEQTEDLRFAVNQLVTVKKGGLDAGTWFHEDLALEFARWLSPTFAVWCNTKIKELLTRGETFIGSNDQDAFILQAYQMLQQRVVRLCQEEKRPGKRPIERW